MKYEVHLFRSGHLVLIVEAESEEEAEEKAFENLKLEDFTFEEPEIDEVCEHEDPLG